MKLNQLHQIEDAIKNISNATGTEKIDIISALTGIAWDEGDAVVIVEFMIDAIEEEQQPPGRDGHAQFPLDPPPP